ncbi:MAG: HNH endonuclease [Bacilli bacterium]|nr:HNH endonuclease [Bacilli bacterium]
MEWKKTNGYKITARFERSVINNDIRYEVLKRDNFRCKLCGMSAEDGVKLHVDHIIPVSKGGKSTMNNLQTLCERCNLGKSNK